MNPQTLEEAKRLFWRVKSKIQNPKSKNKKPEIVICPPFVYLPAVSCKLSAVSCGAQNVFWAEQGAYTGEISPKMLKDLGCNHVIIGHSERRQHFKETDEMINKKIKAAIEVGLNVILCVGEKQGEDVTDVLKNQLIKDLQGFPESKIKLLNIAYEPVWAIGTGNFCEPSQALEANLFIRKILTNIFDTSTKLSVNPEPVEWVDTSTKLSVNPEPVEWVDKKSAEKIRILYGGSVNSKISASYIIEAQMEGLLVGGASLDPGEFARIVRSVS